ncbi:MAG: hypothetical protein QOE70_3069 [Chthoniobacter sp.]|jgi:hypothetical protein|nr:hypothetical protein [Chthoniobacter sp.]
MLPLAGSQFPDSPASLAQALKGGLAQQAMEAREVAAAGAWPALDFLKLDLTGLQISRTHKFPVATTTDAASFTTASFELRAAPAQWESTPLNVSLRAEQAAFKFARTADQQGVLLLARTDRGEVKIEVTRSALEALLHTFAAEAAGKHGVQIKKTKLEFTSRGPRAVSFRAEVTAKMFLVTAVLCVSGALDVDDQLNARLSGLGFSGDGMIASVAGGYIRPQLEKLEGRTFPLLTFAIDEIKLRDIQLEAGESLRLTAQFGS